MLMSHNLDVYNQLENNLQEHNKTCVIMGTGVGKTYVTLEYLVNHNLTALIITPRHTINESWKKVCGDRVDTLTYAKFSMIYRDIDYSFYDVIVCDEVTHIGAPKWGEGIKYIIDNNILPVIGLTEDSVRYTDGGRDVANEYFSGSVSLGESVSSAIEKQILNPVTYVGAFFNSDGLKKTIRGKIQSRLYAKLNLAINKTPTVEEIIRKNMPDGKRKGIIFASTIDDIKYAMDFVHSIYPDVQIQFIHSKRPESVNKEIMDWFKNTDSGYICSVDMISEGVHIPGVNTLIMLRRTESVNLFNQQLGRCLSASTREPAILFDLVNNKYSIHTTKKGGIRVQTNSIFDSGKLNIRESEQLIVKDYTTDIVSVLREIHLSINGHYTPEEDAIIRENVKQGLDYLYGLLPNHSQGSIRSRIYDLGLKLTDRKSPSIWTPEEIKTLKKYFPIYGGNKKMRDLLPARKQSVINKKAQDLGLKNPNLKLTTAEEDAEFVKKNYKSMSITECARALGVSTTTVKKYVKELNLHKEHARLWTKEEDEILRKYYKKELGSVAKRLPGRTKKSCITRAKIIGCTRMPRVLWTDEEIEEIKRRYPVEGGFEMPNRSAAVVRRKAQLLGLKSPRLNRRILCVETGVIYESYEDVENKTGYSSQFIARVCKKLKNHKTAYGYHWEYV